MPDSRARLLNSAPLRPDGRHVVYFAHANRRIDSNHALQYAVELANRHGVPTLVYEGLTYGHAFANDRFHTFILEGVAENERRARELGLGYAFYLRRNATDPNDILYRLTEDAVAVVADDYPSYLPHDHNRSVPQKLDCAYIAVDASCIVPMSAIGKQQYAAYTIRPRIHKLLGKYLEPVPPLDVKKRYVEAPPSWHTSVSAENIPEVVACCDIDHTVTPSAQYRGGRGEALRRLQEFLDQNLARYARYSSKPSEKATSRLSPYLHFGHISSLEIALVAKAHAEEHKLIATEFLEELIVRRELAFNFARYGPEPARLEALPDWARATLAKHDGDARDPVYTRSQWEQAQTHDALWNATQRELLRDGVIHGYYRMYWGKKIMEWSATHQQALDTMLYLHDRYALDGRDPNTYTNVLWCFGLHDRPWAERAIFGMTRYMSLEGMKRKTDVEAYIREQCPAPTLLDTL